LLAYEGDVQSSVQRCAVSVANDAWLRRSIDKYNKQGLPAVTEELAVRLKIMPSHLTLWILGAEPMPPDVFLKAVDLISEHDGFKNLPT
jgi:hypothetical protein